MVKYCTNNLAIWSHWIHLPHQISTTKALHLEMKLFIRQFHFREKILPRHIRNHHQYLMSDCLNSGANRNRKARCWRNCRCYFCGCCCCCCCYSCCYFWCCFFWFCCYYLQLQLWFPIVTASGVVVNITLVVVVVVVVTFGIVVSVHSLWAKQLNPNKINRRSAIQWYFRLTITVS